MVQRRPRYTKRDLAAGTRHEMEHTKDRKVAKEIALQHLKEHPTYYRILPAAEAVMNTIENKPPGKPRRRHHRPVPQNPYVPGLPRWGSMPF